MDPKSEIDRKTKPEMNKNLDPDLNKHSFLVHSSSIKKVKEIVAFKYKPSVNPFGKSPPGSKSMDLLKCSCGIFSTLKHSATAHPFLVVFDHKQKEVQF